MELRQNPPVVFRILGSENTSPYAIGDNSPACNRKQLKRFCGYRIRRGLGRTVILRIGARDDRALNGNMGKPNGVKELNSKSSTARRLRVLLADDHPEMLEEIRSLLAREFEIVGSVGEGQALLSAVEQLRPDAVVCDIKMPLVDGIEAGRRILREGLCAAVILLTMYNDRHLVHSALEAGIRGYVLKVDAGEELALAVATVADGGTYLSRGVPSARAGL